MESEIFQFEPAKAKLIPARLKEGREAKNLNQSELAGLVDVTPQAISQFEGDQKQPEWSTLMKISQQLDLPVSYFTNGRPLGGNAVATAFFRSFKTRTKAMHKMLRRWSVWAAQLTHYISHVVNLPEVVVPTRVNSAYTDEEIEKIATDCRRLWGLADGPIANVVALLESKGFIVIRAEMGVSNVDAFSCWQDDRPFIFLASDKNCAVRSRFDAAHELGHMILHGNVMQEEIEDMEILNRVEHEANRFASAFLLPARTFVSEIYSSNLNQFVELKKRWKVAIGAMIYRCRDLGVFDEHHHINLRKQMSFHNMVKREPLDDVIPVEQTQLIAKAVKLLFDSNIKSTSDLIVDLRLSTKILARIGNFDESILTNTDQHIEYPLDLKKPDLPRIWQ